MSNVLVETLVYVIDFTENIRARGFSYSANRKGRRRKKPFFVWTFRRTKKISNFPNLFRARCRTNVHSTGYICCFRPSAYVHFVSTRIGTHESSRLLMSVRAHIQGDMDAGEIVSRSQATSLVVRRSIRRRNTLAIHAFSNGRSRRETPGIAASRVKLTRNY